MFRTEPMNATLIAMRKLFNLILLSAFVAFAVVACSKDDDDEILNNKEVVDNGNNDNGDKDNTNNGDKNNNDSDKDNNDNGDNGSDNGNDNGDVDNGDDNGDVNNGDEGNNGDEETNGGSNNDGGDEGNGYDPTNDGRFVGPLAWMYEGYKEMTDYDKECCNLWFDRLGSLESTYHNGTYYVNTETYYDGTMVYDMKGVFQGIGYHLITLDEWDVIRERFIHGYYSLVPLNKTIYVGDSDKELYDLVDYTLVDKGLADEPTIIIHNIIGEAPYWINETRQQGLKLACFHRPYPKEHPDEWDLIYIYENDLNNKEQRYPLIFIDEYGDYRRGGQQ